MGDIPKDGNDPDLGPQRTESSVVNPAKGYKIVLEPVPVIRKNRRTKASIAIFSITATLVLVFCFITGKVVEYHPDTSSSSTQKNTTRICLRKEKYALPNLFTTALSLLSIVIGTLVDRFMLVAEERHHVRERYGGSCKKMIKACFSGIRKGAVISFSTITFLTVVVLILLGDMPCFEVRYLVTICGGIGVGPLVMHLLNLNTQSEVHISTILEERGTNVAHVLAWSYYINYLKEALPKFKEMINSSPEGTLSLKKLLLLIPLDRYTEDDLTALDGNIKKVGDIGNDHAAFQFPVYQLKIKEGEPKKFAIQYVKEPLKALEEMSKLKEIKAVTGQSREVEVKLLYRSLSQIIESPPDQQCRGKCKLVPIMATTLERLDNGGLVDLIINVIESPCAHTDRVSQPSPRGFRKLVSVNEGETSTVDLENPCKSNKASKKNTQGAKTQSSHITTYNDQRGNGENINLDFNENDFQKGKSLKRQYKEKTPNETELKQMIPAERTMSDSFNTSHEKANDGKHTLVAQEKEGNDEGASTSGHNLQADFVINEDQQTNQDESFCSDDEHRRLTTSQS